MPPQQPSHRARQAVHLASGTVTVTSLANYILNFLAPSSHAVPGGTAWDSERHARLVELPGGHGEPVGKTVTQLGQRPLISQRSGAGHIRCNGRPPKTDKAVVKKQRSLCRDPDRVWEGVEYNEKCTKGCTKILHIVVYSVVDDYRTCPMELNSVGYEEA